MKVSNPTNYIFLLPGLLAGVRSWVKNFCVQRHLIMNKSIGNEIVELLSFVGKAQFKDIMGRKAFRMIPAKTDRPAGIGLMTHPDQVIDLR